MIEIKPFPSRFPFLGESGVRFESIEEFILQEVFKIKTDLVYGSDFTNQKFGYIRNYAYTFFTIDTRSYLVSFEKVNKTYIEVAFMSAKAKKELSDNPDNYTYDATGDRQSPAVLTTVISLISIFLSNQSERLPLVFRGGTDRLDQFYSRLVQNQSFLKIVGDHGYTYSRIDKLRKAHIFEFTGRKQ